MEFGNVGWAGDGERVGNHLYSVNFGILCGLCRACAFVEEWGLRYEEIIANAKE